MRRPLSPRQALIVRGWSEGKSNEQIADELGIKVETVRTHADRARDRLGASTQAEAVAIWLKGAA